MKMKVSIFFFSNKAMQSEDLMNLECLDFNCLHKWIVMIQKNWMKLQLLIIMHTTTKFISRLSELEAFILQMNWNLGLQNLHTIYKHK